MLGAKARRTPPQTVLLILLAVGAGGLKDVRVTVPEAVASGATVTLHCRYDLETDSLYSVKWYKGRREFFRYIPKELPHTRVFPMQGVDVDVGRSGPASLVLRSVTPSLSGRYRCEVSADAPSFHTAMKTSYMQVVELPVGSPIVEAKRMRVAAGDTLTAKCTSPPSQPPANLTWFLNGHIVNATTYEVLPIEGPFNKRSLESTTMKPIILNTSLEGAQELNQSKDALSQEFQWTDGGVSEEPRLKMRSVSTLTMVVKQETLRHGTLRLMCKANLYNLYNAHHELSLIAERPQTASVLVLATGHTHSGTSHGYNILKVIYCIFILLNITILR